MYGQRISLQGVAHPTSPGQPRKKPAFVIQSPKDYSGQLLALGKGADTVLIKDMIRKSNQDMSATDSSKPAQAPESAPATPISSSRRQRSNQTAYQRRRKYISQVPPQRPELSPPIGYSKAVRCSSNAKEFDPEVIMFAL